MRLYIVVAKLAQWSSGTGVNTDASNDVTLTVVTASIMRRKLRCCIIKYTVQLIVNSNFLFAVPSEVSNRFQVADK